METVRPTLESIEYEDQDREVSWQGVSLDGGSAFETFMVNHVASRLHDKEAAEEFESYLRGLASTGFAQESLTNILSAEVAEERDWAIGEAIAEAYLMRTHNIVWPWNMERDKRVPLASLPGADLVGFIIDDDNVRLVLGEVKTSSDTTSPPGVMNGRSGMRHQIDKLATNLSLVARLLRWLLPRCKETKYEGYFKKAVAALLESGNKLIALFGVLVRDTKADELDLRARGRNLATALSPPSTCQLCALYLPCAIADLPTWVRGDSR